MSFHLTTTDFMEIILGIVTLVWAASFAADLIFPTFNADQINNIFLVVIGSGIAIRAVAGTQQGNNNK